MGGPITFNIKGMDEVKELLKRMEGAGKESAVEGIHDWLDFTNEVAEQLLPVGKSGDLGRHQDVILTKDGGSIINDSAHARPVHFGYTQHPVAPVRRKALHWKNEKGEFFSKGHDVPGRKRLSKPNPWIFNAVQGSMQYIKDFILDSYNKKIGA